MNEFLSALLSEGTIRAFFLGLGAAVGYALIRIWNDYWQDKNKAYLFDMKEKFDEIEKANASRDISELLRKSDNLRSGRGSKGGSA